jgi:hypothetical protein
MAALALNPPRKEFEDMVLQRSTRWLIAAAFVVLLMATATAEAKPTATAAGGDAPPLNPSIIGVPIDRTANAISNATDAVDSGNGAQAVGPLRASRRYLIRSYNGAKYLIANMPPPDAEEARVSSRRFIRLARRAISASRRVSAGGWIRAQASGDLAGPVFADAPTAVFNVLTSQYSAATAAAGMVPDVKGNLLNRVRTTLNTAIVLRNRLVKKVAAAAPPVVDDARVHARASQEAEEATTFDMVMPGLAVLLADEIQQLQAMSQDTSVPDASRAALTNAIAADNQILTRVNTLWPPATED